jgi:hypothetical protein
VQVSWKKEPDDHDYPAADNYLTLLLADAQATDLVAAIQAAPLTVHKAKDILRAARLPLLAPDNSHVASDLDKVKHGDPLSPILIVRGDLARGIPLQIADGYHRVCASYHVNENTDIPCRIADLPQP